MASMIQHHFNHFFVHKPRHVSVDIDVFGNEYCVLHGCSKGSIK